MSQYHKGLLGSKPRNKYKKDTQQYQQNVNSYFGEPSYNPNPSNPSSYFHPPMPTNQYNPYPYHHPQLNYNPPLPPYPPPQHQYSPHQYSQPQHPPPQPIYYLVPMQPLIPVQISAIQVPPPEPPKKYLLGFHRIIPKHYIPP